MDPNPSSSNSQSMGSSFSSPQNHQTLDPQPDLPTPSPAPDSPDTGRSIPPDVGPVEDSTEEVGGAEGGEGGEGEEEEAECGFCLFMKAGGCRDEFVAWEKCVQEAENDGGDIAERCFEVTSMLKKCMDAHADYYEPILSAEKAIAEEVEKEKADEEDKKESEAMESKSQQEAKKEPEAEGAKSQEEAKKEPGAEEVKVEVITVRD